MVSLSSRVTSARSHRISSARILPRAFLSRSASISRSLSCGLTSHWRRCHCFGLFRFLCICSCLCFALSFALLALPLRHCRSLLRKTSQIQLFTLTGVHFRISQPKTSGECRTYQSCRCTSQRIALSHSNHKSSNMRKSNFGLSRYHGRLLTTISISQRSSVKVHIFRRIAASQSIIAHNSKSIGAVRQKPQSQKLANRTAAQTHLLTAQSRAQLPPHWWAIRLSKACCRFFTPRAPSDLSM